MIFNSGYSETNNSNAIDAVNNLRTGMVAAGVEYAQGESTVSALATISDTDFSNRGALEQALGLSSTVVSHSASLSYSRQINPNLSISGQFGLTGITNALTLALPKSILPSYSIAATWAWTPKLSLTASGARTVAPPTTVIGNAEIAYLSQVNLRYQATPKISLGFGASAGTTSVAFTPLTVGAIAGAFTGIENFYTVHASLSYTMTPFLAASLSASYSERVENRAITSQDIISLNVSYRPY